MFDYLTRIPTEVFDAIGFAGFVLYVLSDMMLTFQQSRGDQMGYFVINALAASMVLIGLFNAFNLASALIQVFWIAISTAGILIRFRRNRRIDPRLSTRREV